MLATDAWLIRQVDALICAFKCRELLSTAIAHLPRPAAIRASDMILYVARSI